MSDHDMVVFGILFAQALLILMSVAFVIYIVRDNKWLERKRKREEEERRRKILQRAREHQEMRRRRAAEHLEWMKKAKR